MANRGKCASFPGLFLARYRMQKQCNLLGISEKKNKNRDTQKYFNVRREMAGNSLKSIFYMVILLTSKLFIQIFLSYRISKNNCQDTFQK